METIKQKRSAAQDITKAFCIISVIFAHVVQLPSEADKYVYCFIAFAMSFFFIISGYNYHGMKGTYGQVIWKRFKQLIVPLLFVCLGFTIIMGGYAMLVHGSSVKAIGVSLLTSITGVFPSDYGIDLKSLGFFPFLIPSWFVWFMFFGYILFYAIADWCKKSTPRAISMIVLGIIITTVCHIFKLNEIPFVKIIICIPFVISQLLLGTLLAKAKLLTNEGNKLFIIINSVIAFILLTVIGYFYPKHGMFAAGVLVKRNSVMGFWEVPFTFFVGFLFTYYFMHFARLLEKVPLLSKFMEFTGRNSLYVYLIHMAFITLFKDALKIDSSTGFSWKMVLAFALAVIASDISIYLVQLISKAIKSKKAKQNELPA